MQPLEIEVSLQRRQFDAGITDIKTTLGNLQSEINATVASMKNSTSTSGRGTSASNTKMNALEKTIVLLRAQNDALVESRQLGLNLADSQSKVATATKTTQAAFQGATQQQQQYVTALGTSSRNIVNLTKFRDNALRSLQKQTEEFGKSARAALNIQIPTSATNEFGKFRSQLQNVGAVTKQVAGGISQLNNTIATNIATIGKEEVKTATAIEATAKRINAANQKIAKETLAQQLPLGSNLATQVSRVPNFVNIAKIDTGPVAALSKFIEKTSSDTGKLEAKIAAVNREISHQNSLVAQSNLSKQFTRGANLNNQLSQVPNFANVNRIDSGSVATLVKFIEKASSETGKLEIKIATVNAEIAKQNSLVAQSTLIKQFSGGANLTNQLSQSSNFANITRIDSGPVVQLSKFIEKASIEAGRLDAKLIAVNEEIAKQNSLIAQSNLDRQFSKGANLNNRFSQTQNFGAIPKIDKGPVVDLNKELDKSVRHMERLSNAAKENKTFLGSFFGTIGSFLLRFSAFTIGAGLLIRGVFGIQQVITGVVERAITFQKTMESASFALTAILVNSRQLQTSSGLVASIVSAYPVFLQKAKQFQQELLILNIKTLGTGEELQGVFQRVLAFSQTQRATDEERLRLTQNITNAAKLLGLTGEQINTETRQLLTLESERGQTILQSLGITAKQLRVYRDQGTLVQELNKLLSAYSVIANDVALTFDGLTSTVSTFVDILAGAAFEQTFAGLKDILNGVGKELLHLTETGRLFVGLDSSKADLEAFGVVVADTIAKFIKLIAEATNAIIDFGVRNQKYLGIAVDAFLGFASALAAPLHAIGTLGEFIVGLVGHLKDLTTTASLIPGLHFLQDQSSELVKKAEGKPQEEGSSFFNKSRLIGATATGAALGAILSKLAARYAAVTAASSLASAGIFGASAAAAGATGGLSLLAQAGIGAVVLALVELKNQNESAIESTKRFGELKSEYLKIAESVIALGKEYPKTTKELDDFLKRIADTQKSIDALTGQFASSDQEGTKVFIDGLKGMKNALGETTDELERTKNGIKALSETDIKNLDKLAAFTKKIAQDLRDAQDNADLTAKAVTELPKDAQILAAATAEEKKRKDIVQERLEIEKRYQQEISKRTAQLEAQDKLAAVGTQFVATSKGEPIRPPILVPPAEQLKAFLASNIQLLQTSDDVKDKIRQAITELVKLENQARRDADAIDGSAESLEKLNDILKELKDTTAETERDYQSFLDKLSNTSNLDFQADKLIRLAEAQKKFSDIEKQYPGVKNTSLGPQIEEELNKKAEIDRKQDLFKREQDARDSASALIQIERDTADTVSDIRGSQLDREQALAERRKADAELRLNEAESNFGKQGRINNTLDAQASLIKKITTEELNLKAIQANRSNEELTRLEKETISNKKLLEENKKIQQQALKGLNDPKRDAKEIDILTTTGPLPQEQKRLTDQVEKDAAKMGVLRAEIEGTGAAMTRTLDAEKLKLTELTDSWNEKVKTAFADLNEKSGQAGRQFATALGEFSLQSGDALIARLNEVNLEMEEITTKLEKDFGKDNLRQFEQKLQEIQANKGSVAVIRSIKDEEEYANKRIDLAIKTQEALQAIERSGVEVQKIASEDRLEALRQELDFAEKNASIAGKGNGSLESRAGLIRQVAEEEVALIQLDIREQQLNAANQRANIDKLNGEINKLEERRQTALGYLGQNPTTTKEDLGRTNTGFDIGRTELVNDLQKAQGEFDKTQATVDALGNKSHRVFGQMQEDISDLSSTIIDLNNPIANAFGNLFDSLLKGGKGLKNVFKTLQKDIVGSFSDAFRESIKKKLQFDVDFKGNIFSLGGFFKDTFSEATSFVGNLFGGGGSGGGFLSNLFGSSPTGGTGSNSGGLLGSLFPSYGGSNTTIGSGGFLPQYAGSPFGTGLLTTTFPTQNNGGLFGGGASTLGSLFGFGSSGGTSVSGTSGGFGNILSGLGSLASLGSLFSRGGSGLGSLLSSGGSGLISLIGKLGTGIGLGGGLLSHFFGGSAGPVGGWQLASGLFGGIGSGVGGVGSSVLSGLPAFFGAGGGGWAAAAPGTFAGIPSTVGGNVLGGAGGGFAGALSGALGGIAGGLLGNFINSKFGIGQTKQGQIGSLAGGAVGGIGGGALAGATLGSVVPVIGTAIGAAIGALLGVVGGGALGDLFAPGRIKQEKGGIAEVLDKVFKREKFKELKEDKAARGFESFKGPVSGAAVALGSDYATEAKKGNQGTIIRFAGQALGNFRRLGLDATEAKEHILELAKAMDFDIKSGINSLKKNIEGGVINISEFKEEVKEARKNLKDYGDTSGLTAKELSDLATANGNTGSRLVTVNEIIAGTIDIYTEFDELVSGAAIANSYLAKSFTETAQATGLFNADIDSLSKKVGDGTLSLEEATIELNKFRKEAGLGALDIEDFKISAAEIQAIVDKIKAVMQSLRDSIKSSITTGITVKEFKIEDVEKGFKKSVYQAMVDSVAEGMVDGIIKGSLAAGPISKAFTEISNLTSQFVAGDLSETDFFKQIETVFTDVQPSVDKLAQAVGVTSERFRQMLSDAGILPLLIDDAVASTGALADEIKSAIDVGVRSADDFDIGKQLRRDIYSNIYESVLTGFTDGFIKAATFTEPMKKAMDEIAQLNKDFLAGTITQEQYLAGVQGKFAEIKPVIETIATATGIASEELRKMLEAAGVLPELLEESASVLKGILHDAGKGAILEGLRGGLDAKDIQKSFRRAVYGSLVDSIVEGFVDGFIKATLATGPLEAAMKNIKGLIDKFVAGDINFDQFGVLLGDEFKNITPLVERIAVALGLGTEALREILKSAGILPDILDDASQNAKDLAKELRQAAKDLLLDSTLSPLKPKQRIAQEQANFEQLRLKALAGDKDAAAKLPEAARQFLEDARKVFASSTQYEKIFDYVRATLLDVADKISPLEENEEKQLRTLEEVRSYLKSIDINLAKLTGGTVAKPNLGAESTPLSPSGSVVHKKEYADTAPQTDQEKAAAEIKLIESAQLLALQTINDYSASIDKTLKKMNSENQNPNDQRLDPKSGQDTLPSTATRQLGALVDSIANGGIAATTGPANIQTKATDISTLLQNMDGTLRKTLSLTAAQSDQGTTRLEALLREIRDRLAVIQSYTIWIGNTNQNIKDYLFQMLQRSNGIAPLSFAAGGVVTAKQVPALLHGPEIIIPLKQDKFNTFLGQSSELQGLIASALPFSSFNAPIISASFASPIKLNKGGIINDTEVPALLHGPEAVIPLPYGRGGGVHFSSPELIEEVRMLRSEVRNSGGSDSSDQPIIVHGDFNIGQEKLGEFVMKKVQNGLDKGQLRLPKQASRF